MTLTTAQFATVVVDTIKKASTNPTARLDTLERRVAFQEVKIADLQAARHLKFAGVYADTGTYQPGDCTTRQGSLWICKSDTGGLFDHAAWTLAVKKGSAP